MTGPQAIVLSVLVVLTTPLFFMAVHAAVRGKVAVLGIVVLPLAFMLFCIVVLLFWIVGAPNEDLITALETLFGSKEQPAK